MDAIIEGIIELFNGLKEIKYGRELLVFIVSILPVLELRGGIIAARILEVKPLVACLVSVVGNILPIPFILLFINKILDWMEKSKIKWMNKMSKWLHKKADKNKAKIEKYGYWGLLLFVGIPLPGTGAWTGCLVASVLNLNWKKAFLSILAGIMLACIIMMTIFYGDYIYNYLFT